MLQKVNSVVKVSPPALLIKRSTRRFCSVLYKANVKGGRPPDCDFTKNDGEDSCGRAE